MFTRGLKQALSGRPVAAVGGGTGLRFGGSVWMCARSASSETTGTGVVNYFSMFPKTFPSGLDSPGCGFTVDAKKLRKEYRKLQSVSHPDLNNSLNKSNDGVDSTTSATSAASSSLINKAYETLLDPLKRAQYILLMQAGIDLSNDEVGKSLQFQDKAMLFEMMEIHEKLESIMNEKELEAMKRENQNKIQELCETLTELFAAKEWDKAALATIRLKYCYNIKNALKEWEAGKPVTLTH